MLVLVLGASPPACDVSDVRRSGGLLANVVARSSTQWRKSLYQMTACSRDSKPSVM